MGITSLDAEPGRLVVEQLPEGLDGVGPLRLLGVVEASPSPWLRHLRLPCQPHPLLVLQIQLYFNVAVVVHKVLGQATLLLGFPHLIKEVAPLPGQLKVGEEIHLLLSCRRLLDRRHNLLEL